MRQAGYTLVEMLAALLIIGLAIGALVQALTVITRSQTVAVQLDEQSRALAEASNKLNELVTQAQHGDPALAALRGDPSRLDMRCAASTCGAVVSSDGHRSFIAFDLVGGRHIVELPGVSGARFMFEGERNPLLSWPAKTQTDEGRQVLRAIVLEGVAQGASRPLARVQIAPKQPWTCDFDMISQSCREDAL